MKKIIKFLAIGNSFTEDATYYLYPLLKLHYEEVYIAFLYIGGATLALHDENIKNNRHTYNFHENNDNNWRITPDYSIKDALKKDDWDFVCLQQASGYSGLIESYEPYLSSLIGYIKKETSSKMPIYFHQTWSYSKKSNHEHFSYYDENQSKMDTMIESVIENVIKKHNDIDKVISVGPVIKALRTEDNSLTRDGFHLSDEGRRIAATVFYNLLCE